MTLLRGQTTGQYTSHLVVETCCNCGVTFGLAAEHQAELRQNRTTFFCPNGHSQHYIGKTDAELERERADRLARQLEYANTRATAATDQAQTAERRRRAEKGHRTRLQRKLAAGECPCCHETFPELRTHLAEAHPEFPAADLPES